MRPLPLLSAICLAAGLLSTAPAALALTQEEATALVAERYGVEVLRAQASEVDGQRAWLLTVMEPGGTSNSAFRVTRLAVDRETGDLIPSFRHGSSGYQLPGSGGRFTRDTVQPSRAAGTVWR
ncbi:hypothetical protein [Algihabitans albus]|uniref:hypothetical protein n=1 Tax=Algihabitans albus TaxID=2164067 RepID=UPI000E5D519D|nr:hypothetical protein [Algihabitans albus]